MAKSVCSLKILIVLRGLKLKWQWTAKGADNCQTVSSHPFTWKRLLQAEHLWGATHLYFLCFFSSWLVKLVCLLTHMHTVPGSFLYARHEIILKINLGGLRFGIESQDEVPRCKNIYLSMLKVRCWSRYKIKWVQSSSI